VKLIGAARYTRVTLRTVLRRLAIAAILAISLGAPIAELFDTWDQTLQTGSDTEANGVVVALCIGVAFAIGTIVVNRVRSLASASASRLVLSRAAPREIASLFRPAPTVSPPAILRV
jgi:drug/metabolite transporter (DMT)-like permease